MVLGVSGHQGIPASAKSAIVDALRERVRAERSPVGVCSLAAGADQLFAREVLDNGGELHVIIPCIGYETTFEDTCDRGEYERLLARADQTVELAYSRPSEAAFFAAGRRVVEECEQLLAVWDGLPAKGAGGTADVVAYARERGRSVLVIWPAGTPPR
jgi:hypothetical protein